MESRWNEEGERKAENGDVGSCNASLPPYAIWFGTLGKKKRANRIVEDINKVVCMSG